MDVSAWKPKEVLQEGPGTQTRGLILPEPGVACGARGSENAGRPRALYRQPTAPLWPISTSSFSCAWKPWSAPTI